MSKRLPAGRASIFRDKTDGVRVQGVLRSAGAAFFERHRADLGKLYAAVRGTTPKTVSDADVIEYLALGPVRTRRYLERG